KQRDLPAIRPLDKAPHPIPHMSPGKRANQSTQSVFTQPGPKAAPIRSVRSPSGYWGTTAIDAPAGRPPGVHRPITVQSPPRSEAEFARLEAAAAVHRADFERERERCR